MNRPIKFRIWDRIYSKWVENQYEFGPSFINAIFECDSSYIFQQFTGIVDKNGKEIYEGDICKINLGGETYVTKTIEFFNGMFIFGNKNHNCLSEYTDKFFELKVIGNIFENPELL